MERKQIVVVEFNSEDAREAFQGVQLDVQESEKVALIYATNTELKEEMKIETVPGTYTEQEIADLIKTANEEDPEARAERQTKKVKYHTNANS